MKKISKRDTDRICLHMLVVRDLLSKLEDEYGEIKFNKDAKLFSDEILYAAEAVERAWNNTSNLSL